METAVDLLVNGSPMAAFAIFLIYLYTTTSKKTDALVDKFMEQIEKMREGNKGEIEEMRQRYDVVIERYHTEQGGLRGKLFTVAGEINRTVDAVSLAQEGTTAMIEDLMDRVKALEARGSKLQLGLDKTCDTLKEMQQETKLKELADKAVAARQ
jgi:hypothetical protein